MFVSLTIFFLTIYQILYSRAVKNQKECKRDDSLNLYSRCAIEHSSYRLGDKLEALCSIIIPAHNEEKVIKDTIMNCLQQTYKNIEVIVVCHNCNDGTYAKCMEVTDRRVRPVNLQTVDSGKGIALNHGVKMSKGNYLLILDGDGRLNKTFVEDVLPMFNNSKYAAVQGRYIPSNRGYNFITRMLALEGDLWSTPFMTMRSVLSGRTHLGGTGYIIRRSALLDVGGFSNHLVDDYELSFRLFKKKFRIVFAPLSINYDEKPPSLDIMFNQRARWMRGFLSLLKIRITEPRDIIGIFFWINPISNFTNLVVFSLLAYSTLHYIGFHYFPFHFAYISLTTWLGLIMTNLGLNVAVLVRQYGKEGLKLSALLPLYLAFSNYYLIASIKSFFIKSWGETKTAHGFGITNVEDSTNPRKLMPLQ